MFSRFDLNVSDVIVPQHKLLSGSTCRMFSFNESSVYLSVRTGLDALV